MFLQNGQAGTQSKQGKIKISSMLKKTFCLNQNRKEMEQQKADLAFIFFNLEHSEERRFRSTIKTFCLQLKKIVNHVKQSAK